MMPVTRDQCGRFFFREWSGGIIAGGFEPRSKPCFHEGIPKPYEFMLMSEDWDHFRKRIKYLLLPVSFISFSFIHLPEVLMDQMLLRIPSLKDAEIRQLLNGAESFTPDHRCIFGEAPNVRSVVVPVSVCFSQFSVG